MKLKEGQKIKITFEGTVHSQSEDMIVIDIKGAMEGRYYFRKKEFYEELIKIIEDVE